MGKAAMRRALRMGSTQESQRLAMHLVWRAQATAPHQALKARLADLPPELLLSIT
jgi:hypothetical protein